MAWVVEGAFANGDSTVSKLEVIIVFSPTIILSTILNSVNIGSRVLFETYVVSVAPSFSLKTSLSFLCLHHLLSYLHFWQYSL